MNIMNMPGFTAEASLHKTTKHYHVAMGGSHVSGSVYPAQMVVPYKPLTPEMIDNHYVPPYSCWVWRLIPKKIDNFGHITLEYDFVNIC